MIRTNHQPPTTNHGFQISKLLARLAVFSALASILGAGMGASNSSRSKRRAVVSSTSRSSLKEASSRLRISRACASSAEPTGKRAGSQRVEPVRSLARWVPRNLAAACDKALAVRREDRYQSAGELGISLYGLTPIDVSEGGSLVTIAFHETATATPASTPIALAALVILNGHPFTTSVD